VLGFLLERVVSDNEFDVGDVFESVLGNGGVKNELDGLGAGGGVGCAAIGEATPFHGRGAVPEGTFAAAEEFSVLSGLAGVNVDGCVGLVGAGTKEDLQGESSGRPGHVGPVKPRAAARKWGWGGQGQARASARGWCVRGWRIWHPQKLHPLV